VLRDGLLRGSLLKIHRHAGVCVKKEPSCWFPDAQSERIMHSGIELTLSEVLYMCSIFAVLNINGDLQALRQLVLRQSRLMRHRGPDWSGINGSALGAPGSLLKC
jgi:hypothetical protein